VFCFVLYWANVPLEIAAPRRKGRHGTTPSAEKNAPERSLSRLIKEYSTLEQISSCVHPFDNHMAFEIRQKKEIGNCCHILDSNTALDIYGSAANKFKAVALLVSPDWCIESRATTGQTRPGTQKFSISPYMNPLCRWHVVAILTPLYIMKQSITKLHQYFGHFKENDEWDYDERLRLQVMIQQCSLLLQGSNVYEEMPRK